MNKRMRGLMKNPFILLIFQKKIKYKEFIALICYNIVMSKSRRNGVIKWVIKLVKISEKK